MDYNIDLLLKSYSAEELEEIIINSNDRIENFDYSKNDQRITYPVMIKPFSQS